MASQHLPVSSSQTNLVMLGGASPTNSSDRNEYIREQTFELDRVLVAALAEKEKIDFTNSVDERGEVMKFSLESLAKERCAQWSEAIQLTGESEVLFRSLGGWQAMILKLHQIVADVMNLLKTVDESVEVKASNLWECSSLLRYIQEMHCSEDRAKATRHKYREKANKLPPLPVRWFKASKLESLNQSHGRPHAEITNSGFVLVIDLQMLWLAVQCGGRFDYLFSGAVAAQLHTVGFYKRRNELFWSDRERALSVSDVAYKTYVNVCSKMRMFASVHDWYQEIFSVPTCEDGVFMKIVEDVTHLVRSAQYNPHDVSARNRIAHLLVGMMASPHKGLANEGVKLLCTHDDMHNWQRYSALPTVNKFVNDAFIISLPDLSNLPAGDAENLFVVVHSLPSIRRGSERETLTMHQISLGTRKLNFGWFVRNGYYDWCLVRAGSVVEDPLEPVVLDGVEVKGRMIVRSREAKMFSFEEIPVDVVNAEVVNGKVSRRGTFGDIASMIPELKSSNINAINVVGVAARDTGPVEFDSALGQLRCPRPEASPYAATCRASPGEFQGGAASLKRLVNECNQNGVKMFVDVGTRVSSSHYHRKYSDYLLHTVDESGKVNLLYGSTGRGMKPDETCQLNYRHNAAWDLMLQDVISWPNKFGVHGVRIEDCGKVPQIYPIDNEELYKRDPDGMSHYNVSEMLVGQIVRPTANVRKSGYWGSSACREGYPNPFLVKISRAVWREHPDFNFMGDVAEDTTDELTLNALIRSGMIPQIHTLPRHMAATFGKKLSLGGSVAEGLPEEVGTPQLMKWMAQMHESLPEGGLVSVTSFTHSSPLPALLYQRGAWSAVDMLYLSGFLPSVLYGERQGSSYRLDGSNFFYLTDDDGKRVKSSTDLPYGSFSGHGKALGSAVSLQGVVDLQNVARLENENRQTMSQLHFDLSKHKDHMVHRAGLWLSHCVLRDGYFIPLALCDDNPAVFAVARVRVGPPSNSKQQQIHMVIVVGNCTFEPLNVSVSLSSSHRLRELLENWHDCSLLIENDLLKECSRKTSGIVDTPWDIKELLSADLNFHLNAQGLEMRGYRPFSTDVSSNKLKELLVASMHRQGEFFVRSLLDAIDPEAPWTKLRGLLKSVCTATDTSMFMSIIQKLPDSVFSDDHRAQLQARLKLMSAAGDEMAKKILVDNQLGPVIFSTPELGKWSTVGGLGVMVDELTQVLADPEECAQEVWVFSPYYERNRRGEPMDLTEDGITHTFNVSVQVGHGKHTVGVYEGRMNNVRYFFLKQGEFFPEPYANRGDEGNVMFLSLMALAPLEVLCTLRTLPSTFVTNDWATGLTAAYAKAGFFGDAFKDTQFFHIVHNLDPAYEGRLYVNKDVSWIHRLNRDLLDDPMWLQRIINPSRCALLCSDNWGTVSPSYLAELRRGSPLRHLMERFPAPHAHPNGIPVQNRMERLDKLSVKSHEAAKTVVQQMFFHYKQGDDTVPLYVFVGRITSQKAVHLILDIAEGLIRRCNFRVNILVGGMHNPGEAYSYRCAERLKHLTACFPNCFWADPDHFFTQGPLVNLAADFALMPSQFEPGGIVQQEFFLAGTPVIAFETGGLRDTVFEYNPSTGKGNGVTFKSHTPGDFAFAIERADGIFRHPEQYKKIRLNARESVISCSTVGKSWCSAFYSMHAKPFIKENLVKKYMEMLKELEPPLEPVAALSPPPAIPSDLYEEEVRRRRRTEELEEKEYKGKGLQAEETLPEEAAALPEDNSSPAFPCPGVEGSKHSSVQIVWRNPSLGRHVSMSGSFDNWQARVDLKYNDYMKAYVTTMKLKPGKYLIKFIVDGHWTVVSDYRVEKDAMGNENNVFTVAST